MLYSYRFTAVLFAFASSLCWAGADDEKEGAPFDSALHLKCGDIWRDRIASQVSAVDRVALICAGPRFEDLLAREGTSSRIRLSVDLQTQDEDGNTPLFQLASRGSLRVLKVLKRRGRCLYNYRNSVSENVVFAAVKSGQLELLKWLLAEFPAEFPEWFTNHRTSDSGLNLLEWSAVKGHPVALEFAAEYAPAELETRDGRLINHFSHCGSSLADLAAMENRVECLKVLQKHAPKTLVQKSPSGWAPIAFAAYSIKKDAFKFLFDLSPKSVYEINSQRNTVADHLVPRPAEIASEGAGELPKELPKELKDAMEMLNWVAGAEPNALLLRVHFLMPSPIEVLRKRSKPLADEIEQVAQNALGNVGLSKRERKTGCSGFCEKIGRSCWEVVEALYLVVRTLP